MTGVRPEGAVVSPAPESQRAGAPPPVAARAGRAIVICDPWLGANGYAALKALRRAGWAAEALPEREFVPLRWRSLPMRILAKAARAPAVREFNAELLHLAQRLRPEFLFAFKGAFVDVDTLRQLRTLGVRSYCFYPDVSFHVHGRYLPGALPEYDWVFTTKTFGVRDMREQLGVTRSSVLLHGYDADLHRPVEPDAEDLARYGCDVSFIGTWSAKKEAVLAELIRRHPKLRLRVWGWLWADRARSPALRERAIAGHVVEGEEYVRAVASSAINLAILSERRPGASDGDRVTSRTFHIPACGGFMLHERSPELLELFREELEVGCFEGVDELDQAVEHYLSDAPSRRRIAAAGRAVVESAHSWDHRMRAILDHHATHAPRA